MYESFDEREVAYDKNNREFAKTVLRERRAVQIIVLDPLWILK